MATIQRPTKEGSVRTYQEKVGLGYIDILASEMDADLDTIYAAWNGGTDTINIVDGAVTNGKLATDAVDTRVLADLAVGTANLMAGASVRLSTFAAAATGAWSTEGPRRLFNMPAVTTRGGVVLLFGGLGLNLSLTPGGATPATFHLQIYRDGVAIQDFGVSLQSSAGALTVLVPMPAIMDQPPAGVKNYWMDANLQLGTATFPLMLCDSGLWYLVELA
jgi:hypothetical protein